MRSEDLLRAAEEDLVTEYETKVAPHVGLASAAIQNELQRRATLKLLEATHDLTEAARSISRSSLRLESLTKWLIALTILLLTIAVPPAFEILQRLWK